MKKNGRYMFNNPGQTQVLQFSDDGYVIELGATQQRFSARSCVDSFPTRRKAEIGTLTCSA